jgi:isocitrate dehydrogenase (NAD+)
MSHVITLIPGDGIGPEITESVIRIFKAAGVAVDWDRHDAGVTAFQRYSQSLPADLLDSVHRNKVALKGPLTTPIAEGFRSVNVALRNAHDQYAKHRPVRNLARVESRFSGVDLIIVRENTEDLVPGSSTKWCRASSKA